MIEEPINDRITRLESELKRYQEWAETCTKDILDLKAAASTVIEFVYTQTGASTDQKKAGNAMYNDILKARVDSLKKSNPVMPK
jgi:hypothetical protein